MAWPGRCPDDAPGQMPGRPMMLGRCPGCRRWACRCPWRHRRRCPMPPAMPARCRCDARPMPGAMPAAAAAALSPPEPAGPSSSRRSKPKPEMPGALNAAPPGLRRPLFGLLQPTPYALPVLAPVPRQRAPSTFGPPVVAPPPAQPAPPPQEEAGPRRPRPERGPRAGALRRLGAAPALRRGSGWGAADRTPTPRRRQPPPRGATPAAPRRTPRCRRTACTCRADRVPARCSLRTLVTRPCHRSPSSAIGSLVFRNSSDWAQYRTASVHRRRHRPFTGRDALNQAAHHAQPVCGDEVKAYGDLGLTFNIHHHAVGDERGRERSVVAVLRARCRWCSTCAARLTLAPAMAARPVRWCIRRRPSCSSIVTA